MQVLAITQISKNKKISVLIRLLKYYLAALLLGLSLVVEAENSEYEQLKDETQQMEFDSRYLDASKQKMLGNYKNAINLYLSCLEINPQSAAARFEIARILYANNDFNGAFELMKKVVEINDHNIWYLLFMGELYERVQDYKHALEINDKIIAIDSYNELYYYNRINLYLELGQFKKAEKTFDVVEEKFGISTEFLEEKVKFYLKTNKLSEGEKMLLSLAEKNPYDDKYYIILADLYYQTFQFEKALNIYNQLLESTDDPSSIHLMKAELFLQLRRVDEFASEFKYCLNDASIDVDVKIEAISSCMSDTTLNINKYLIEFAEILNNVHPRNIAVSRLYSSCLIMNSEYDKALPFLYFILDNDKTDLNSYNQILYIEDLNQNWDTIYPLSTQALELYPNQYFLFYYKGLSAYMLEKYDEAITTFLSGITFCPSNEVKSEFYYFVAESYQKQNNKKMSYHFFDKCLSSNSNNAVALNNYSYYLSLNDTLLPQALDMIKKANELEPNVSSYLDSYAWVLYKLQRYDEAKNIIEKAISLLDVENGEIFEHYGDILFRLGDVENAVAQWKNALGKEGITDKLSDKIEKRRIE